jgi:hypothetical protein
VEVQSTLQHAIRNNPLNEQQGEDHVLLGLLNIAL